MYDTNVSSHNIHGATMHIHWIMIILFGKYMNIWRGQIDTCQTNVRCIVFVSIWSEHLLTTEQSVKPLCFLSKRSKTKKSIDASLYRRCAHPCKCSAQTSLNWSAHSPSKAKLVRTSKLHTFCVRVFPHVGFRYIVERRWIGNRNKHFSSGFLLHRDVNMCRKIEKCWADSVVFSYVTACPYQKQPLTLR